MKTGLLPTRHDAILCVKNCPSCGISLINWFAGESFFDEGRACCKVRWGSLAGAKKRVTVRTVEDQGARLVVIAPGICLRPTVFITAAFVALVAMPPLADAACLVTISGTVNCDADTTTTKIINVDGSVSSSSARTQRFHNGPAISGSIQPGITIGGFGLELTEKRGGKNAQEPITLNNQGQVTTSENVNALKLSGDGGPISYSGDGSISSTHEQKAALDLKNVGGDVSVAAGAGAVSGATGIKASASGAGALTIATGSGPVSGNAGEGVLAHTGDSALDVTVGSGGVTSVGDNPAIKLHSENGNISVTANGNVSANGVPKHKRNDIHGIQVTSKGLGNIIVGGSGTVFGQEGRGIFALENQAGLGGIVVTGTGDTISGTPTLGCCSAVRAEIKNPADPSNVIINRSGSFFAYSTQLNPVMAAIHALTAGSGNIIVEGGAGATISNSSLLGINATASGVASSGSIYVSTGTGSRIEASGTGILAENEAFAISPGARSTITVTANGTINSGATSNPVGFGATDGSGAGKAPAGISAGYDGGPIFGPASGPYTSCGFFGCTTLTPNPSVDGAVNVINNAIINAAGNGIYAFNFGKGNVSVSSDAAITAARNGVDAFSVSMATCPLQRVLAQSAARPALRQAPPVPAC